MPEYAEYVVTERHRIPVIVDRSTRSTTGQVSITPRYPEPGDRPWKRWAHLASLRNWTTA